MNSFLWSSFRLRSQKKIAILHISTDVVMFILLTSFIAFLKFSIWIVWRHWYRCLLVHLLFYYLHCYDVLRRLRATISSINLHNSRIIPHSSKILSDRANDKIAQSYCDLWIRYCKGMAGYTVEMCTVNGIRERSRTRCERNKNKNYWRK